MKHITIRDVPQDLARAIEEEKKRRGQSLNQTLIQLLGKSLGVPTYGPRKNGLAALAGTWTAEEHSKFEAATASTEQIDEELWR